VYGAHRVRARPGEPRSGHLSAIPAGAQNVTSHTLSVPNILSPYGLTRKWALGPGMRLIRTVRSMLTLPKPYVV